jgi:hypothetical protein
MNIVVGALKLLPLMIRVVEIIAGAKKGLIKKEAVVSVFFGVVGVVGKLTGVSIDTPELRELVGELIDELVGVFFPHTEGEQARS